MAYPEPSLVLLGSALELFRIFFGDVHAIFWLGVLFWPLICVEDRKNRQSVSNGGLDPFSALIFAFRQRRAT